MLELQTRVLWTEIQSVQFIESCLAGVQKAFSRKFGCQTVRDTFDHDKGQKSAISGRRLHWRLSTGFFAFSPGSLCILVRRAPQKSGESSEKSSGENRVKSCHVCGCHGFFSPETGTFGLFGAWWL